MTREHMLRVIQAAWDAGNDAAMRALWEWSDGYGVWKVHPLADWDEKHVSAYIEVNEIPYNPLHDSGYRSIGCIPCTRPISPEEEERAGRWADSDKLECGLHVEAPLPREG